MVKPKKSPEVYQTETDSMAGVLGSTAAAASINAPYSGIDDGYADGREREFDPSRALVELIHYGKNRTYVVTANELPTSPSTEPLPLPDEIRIPYTRHFRGVQNSIYDRVSSTYKIDKELIAQGFYLNEKINEAIQKFMVMDNRGMAICEVMGIDPSEIHSLSAAQTVELIGYLMYHLTSYAHGDIQAGSGKTSADNSSSLDIILNGMNVDAKEDITPLGLCRNYSDTVQSIFRAFKAENPQLTNTYCHNMSGYAGATNAKLRKKGDEWFGHAWTNFLTVLNEQGDFAVTTVDPTWVHLDEDEKLVRYDVTKGRLSTHLRLISSTRPYNYAPYKAANLENLASYYKDRCDYLIEHMKKSSGKDSREKVQLGKDISPDNNFLQAAMFTAVDYFAAAEYYGGSAFDPEKVDKNMKTLMLHAAKDADIIFSPFEMQGVERALGAYSHRHFIRGEKQEAQEAEKLLRDLQARYASYSATTEYTRIYGLNEQK